VEIAALTAFLAPYLGRLLKPVGEAAGDAAERLGEQAWVHAQALWARLRGRVAEKPAAAEVAGDVANAPDDKDAQAALAYQLKKILAEDPRLEAEIARLWQETQDDPEVRRTVVASGERSIAVGGNLSGTASTGDTGPAARREPPA
jgi:hypothetical protein